MGQHRLRAAVLTGRRVLAASPTRIVRAYADVQLAQALRTQTSVFTAPTFTFTYVDATSAYSLTETAFTIARNYCRSVHLTLAGHTPGGNPAAVSLVQESADPVTVAVDPGAQATLDATVKPGQSWSVTVTRADATQSSNSALVYTNGTASCYAVPSMS
jgi:hypothetical protein